VPAPAPAPSAVAATRASTRAPPVTAAAPVNGRGAKEPSRREGKALNHGAASTHDDTIDAGRATAGARASLMSTLRRSDDDDGEQLVGSAGKGASARPGARDGAARDSAKESRRGTASAARPGASPPNASQSAGPAKGRGAGRRAEQTGRVRMTLVPTGSYSLQVELGVL